MGWNFWNLQNFHNLYLLRWKINNFDHLPRWYHSPNFLFHLAKRCYKFGLKIMSNWKFVKKKSRENKNLEFFFVKFKFWKHFFRENDNSPPSGRVKVAAYIKTGTIRRAEAAHAVRLTHRAITGVRYFGADIGWHTAMYRSAESTVKKMELVNCEKRKEKKKYQITTSFSIFVRLVWGGKELKY